MCVCRLGNCVVMFGVGCKLLSLFCLCVMFAVCVRRCVVLVVCYLLCVDCRCCRCHDWSSLCVVVVCRCRLSADCCSLLALLWLLRVVIVSFSCTCCLVGHFLFVDVLVC